MKSKPPLAHERVEGQSWQNARTLSFDRAIRRGVNTRETSAPVHGVDRRVLEDEHAGRMRIRLDQLEDRPSARAEGLRSLSTAPRRRTGSPRRSRVLVVVERRLVAQPPVIGYGSASMSES